MKYNQKLIVSILIILIFFFIALPLYSAPLTAKVFVNPEVVEGGVNKGVLGNNIIAYVPHSDDNVFVSNTGASVWDPLSKSPVDQFVTLAKRAGISFLRWPGGNQSRILDWKLTVGPLTKRPLQKFGLPEFLTFCSSIGAQPVITIATNVGIADSAADLVEYLNAPCDGSNPNNGVDWAAVRSADGHKDPWNVIWFEYGNEEFNTSISVEQYIKNYIEYYVKMKRVDQNIKIGAIFEDSVNVDDGWTVSVLEKLGKIIDFGIIHPYMPELGKEAAKKIHPQDVMTASVSADADLVYRLRLYRNLIEQVTGRSDMPIAATEYNSHFVQQEPFPYRQTLVNALHNADFVRIFLNSEFRIVFANFWHFANLYWGMVCGDVARGEELIPQANFYVYELYNKYLGDELVKMDVSGPSFEFEGGMMISPRIGLPTVRETDKIQVLTDSWALRLFNDGIQSQSKNILSVIFNQATNVNYYHAYKYFNVNPNTFYKISVLMRTDELKGGKIGIAVEDLRGWNETFYQPSNINRTGTTPWSWVTVEIKTLSDTKKIRLMPRLIGGNEPISGKAEFGQVRIQKLKHNFGAVDSIVGIASKDKGGNLFLVLINKNLNDSVETTVHINGKYKFLKAETLTGPSPLSTNLNPSFPDQVKIFNLYVRKSDVLCINLPKCSITGVSFLE